MSMFSRTAAVAHRKSIPASLTHGFVLDVNFLPVRVEVESITARAPMSFFSGDAVDNGPDGNIAVGGHQIAAADFFLTEEEARAAATADLQARARMLADAAAKAQADLEAFLAGPVATQGVNP
jgi:hypothetical protein